MWGEVRGIAPTSMKLEWCEAQPWNYSHQGHPRAGGLRRYNLVHITATSCRLHWRAAHGLEVQTATIVVVAHLG